jgi:hypothetical protein
MFVERLLRVEGLVGTEVLMLPLGFSIAMLINAVVLTILFQKDFRGFSRGLYRVLFQSGISAIAMGFTAYLFLNILAGLVDINTFIGIFSQGFLSGFAGIVVGVVFLKIMGNEEIDVAWRSIRRKFWKAKTIASGEEV